MSLIQNGLNFIKKDTETIYAVIFPLRARKWKCFVSRVSYAARVAPD